MIYHLSAQTDRIGGKLFFSDWGYDDLLTTNDKGYIYVIQDSFPNCKLILMDSTFKVLWSKKMNDMRYRIGSSIIDKDGSFICLSVLDHSNKYLLSKIGVNGLSVWSDTIPLSQDSKILSNIDNAILIQTSPYTINKIDYSKHLSSFISILGDQWSGISLSFTDRESNLLVMGRINYSSRFGGIDFDSGIGNYTQFLAKYDASGNCLWAKNIDNPSSDRSNFQFSNGFVTDNSGNIVFTHLVHDLNTSENHCVSYLSRYDKNGNETWRRQVSGSVNFVSDCNQICVSGSFYNNSKYSTQDSPFLLGSFSIPYDSSVFRYPFVVLFDSCGNIIDVKAGVAQNVQLTAWNPQKMIYKISSIISQYDTSIPIVSRGLTMNKFYTISSSGLDCQKKSPESSTVEILKVYPNPTTDHTTFSLADTVGTIATIRVSDLSGRVVLDIRGLSVHSYTFTSSTHATGVYLYEVRTATGQLFKGKFEYVN
jgi:hypothetical protein